jgi:SAM-dependent methyltransferase
MRLCTTNGRVLSGERWAAPTSATDERVLEAVDGPVLDVGCGPGRLVRALAERGVVALGIDVTPAAVRRARSDGTSVLRRSVFDPLVGEGRWRTALLLDGNIGIGGDPVALLARLGVLLCDEGRVVVETEPPGGSSAVVRAHLEVDGEVGPAFGWQAVGHDRLSAVASRAGLRIERSWQDAGRWFSFLTRVA